MEASLTTYTTSSEDKRNKLVKMTVSVSMGGVATVALNKSFVHGKEDCRTAYVEKKEDFGDSFLHTEQYTEECRYEHSWAGFDSFSDNYGFGTGTPIFFMVFTFLVFSLLFYNFLTFIGRVRLELERVIGKVFWKWKKEERVEEGEVVE